LLERLRTAISQAVVGQSAVIEQVVDIACRLRARCLIEGCTRARQDLASCRSARGAGAVSLTHGRVQFTPGHDGLRTSLDMPVLDPNFARAEDSARSGVHPPVSARGRDQSAHRLKTQKRAGSEVDAGIPGHASKGQRAFPCPKALHGGSQLRIRWRTEGTLPHCPKRQARPLPLQG